MTKVCDKFCDKIFLVFHKFVGYYRNTCSNGNIMIVSATVGNNLILCEMMAKLTD